MNTSTWIMDRPTILYIDAFHILLEVQEEHGQGYLGNTVSWTTNTLQYWLCVLISLSLCTLSEHQQGDKVTVPTTIPYIHMHTVRVEDRSLLMLVGVCGVSISRSPCYSPRGSLGTGREYGVTYTNGIASVHPSIHPSYNELTRKNDVNDFG